MAGKTFPNAWPILFFIVLVLSLLPSGATGSTCQEGPTDTTCVEQASCRGSCCYITGTCANSQESNCRSLDDPLFPKPGGPEMINSGNNSPDGCFCSGAGVNPNLACAVLTPAGSSLKCWGSLQCDGVGTCKDTGYCQSEGSGAWLGNLCIQNGGSGAYKFCGERDFDSGTLTQEPTRQPSSLPLPLQFPPFHSPPINGNNLTAAPTSSSSSSTITLPPTPPPSSSPFSISPSTSSSTTSTSPPTTLLSSSSPSSTPSLAPYLATVSPTTGSSTSPSSSSSSSLPPPEMPELDPIIIGPPTPSDERFPVPTPPPSMQVVCGQRHFRGKTRDKNASSSPSLSLPHPPSFSHEKGKYHLHRHHRQQQQQEEKENKSSKTRFHTLQDKLTMTAVVKAVGGGGGGEGGVEGMDFSEGGKTHGVVGRMMTKQRQQKQQQKASLPLPVGRRFRYTQEFRSGANETLPESYLVIYLPTFTTFHGKVKTWPKALSVKQLARLDDQEEKETKEEREGEGTRGGKASNSFWTKMERRGSLYQQDAQILFWNVGKVLPGITYKISFNIIVIDAPPAGTDELLIESAFETLSLNEELSDYLDYSFMQCRKRMSMPLFAKKLKKRVMGK